MKRSVLSRVLLLTSAWGSLVALSGVAGCGRDGFYSGAEEAPCTRDAQCAPGLACEDGRCVEDDAPPTCQRGAQRCADSGTLEVCVGGSWEARSCEPGLCDRDACVGEGECVDGQRQCSLDQVYLCIGGEWTPQEVCADGLACIGGECRQGDVRYPDLAVERFSLPGQIFADEEIAVVELRVTNQGDAVMPGVYCELTAERGREVYFLSSTFTQPLDVGERQSLGMEASFFSVPQGSWNVSVRCDPFGEVAELREDNNDASGTIEVIREDFPESADLALYFSEPSSDRVRAGGSLGVELALGNEGFQPLEIYSCSFELSPTTDDRPSYYIGEWRGEFLFPGEAQETNPTLDIPREARGDFFLFTYCESFQSELRFDNNQYFSGRVVRVEPNEVEGLVDLVPRELALRNPFVTLGEPVEVEFSVCNEGRETSPRAQALLSLNSDFGFEQQEVSIERLAPGSCASREAVVFPRFCTEDGAFYILELLVDPENRISELDEFNNNISSFGDIVVSCDGEECAGDRYDFNDINEPPQIDAQESDLLLCPGDADYFELPLTPGLPLQLALILESPVEGLMWATLEGERANGSTFTIATADAIFDTWELRVDVLPTARRYRLLISGAEVFSPVRYSLWTQQETSTAEVDLVAAGINAFGPIVPGQEGFVEYSITNASMTGVNRPFVVGLYGVDGPQDDPARRFFLGRFNEGGLAGGESRSAAFPFGVPDVQSGLLTLVLVVDDTRVIAEFNEMNNVARTTVPIEGGPMMCEDDGLEPNNTFQTAADLGSASLTLEGLKLCGVNRDFYRVCPPAGSQLRISASFEHARGDLDLRLLDPRQQAIDQSLGTNNFEEVSLASTEANACYTLEAYIFGNDAGADQTYTLGVEIIPPVTDDLCSGPASNEPNNDFSQATFIPEVAGQVQALCTSADVDMYFIELAEGEEFVFRADVPDDQPEGDLSVTAYGPNRNFLTFRFARSVEIPITAQAEGAYYFRVASSSAADELRYTLGFSDP